MPKYSSSLVSGFKMADIRLIYVVKLVYYKDLEIISEVHLLEPWLLLHAAWVSTSATESCRASLTPSGIVPSEWGLIVGPTTTLPVSRMYTRKCLLQSL